MKTKLLFLFLGFQMLNAQLIFQDDFSTYNTGVQLSGQGTWSNNTSSGGLGDCSGFGCPKSKVLASATTFLDYGNSVNSAELKQDTDSPGRLFTAQNTGDIYVGFILNLATAATAPTDFLRVCSGGSFNTTMRIFAKAVTGGFTLGTYKGSSGTATYTTQPLALNQDHLVILKYTYNSASTTDDVVSMYINPAFATGEPTIPTVTTAVGTDQTGSMDRIALRQNSTSGLPGGKIGLVSVAKSWSTLAFPIMKNQDFDASKLFAINNLHKNGKLSINSKSTIENVVLNIYNLTGSLVVSKNINLQENENQIEFNTEFATGIYVVEMISKNLNFTQKVIVE